MEIGLGTLQYNGGPHGVLTRSISNNIFGPVNMGDNADCDGTAPADQQLDARSAPRISGANCDPGAFELGAVPTGNQLILRGTAMAGTLSINVLGVTVSVVLAGGEALADVVSALVTEIENYPALMDVPVLAAGLTDGDTGDEALSITEAIASFDPGTTGLSSPNFAFVPILTIGGTLVLLAGLPALAFRRLRRREGEGERAQTRLSADS